MEASFCNIDGKIEQFDIVLGVDYRHGLTYNKPYVVREINGTTLITVKNDLGELKCYSTAWFRKYNNETFF